MTVSKQISDFLDANKYRTREEVINLMMKKFDFKKSTARQRYVDYNSSNRAVNKKKVFDFLIANPHVVEDLESKEYAKKLGMPTSTYTCYKTQYRLAIDLNRYSTIAESIREIPKYGEKYYKGRLREFFKFDDSKLFG